MRAFLLQGAEAAAIVIATRDRTGEPAFPATATASKQQCLKAR
jgi:hypothetical protein